MKSNVKSLLSNLQELNDANTIKVNVPSLGKKVEFKLASVSQQKELIRTLFDGIDGVIKRTNIFNKLITDNCVTEDVEFLLSDRQNILVDIRKHTIGSKYKLKDVEYDLDDLPALDMKSFKRKKKVSHDGIAVNLKVPTLTLDSEVNAKVEAEFAKVSSDDEKVKQSLDLVVAYETSKYITDISLGDETIVFEDVSVYERKQLVNSLPLALNNKILDYIGTIKEATDKALTLSDEVVVEIDSNFLSAD